MFKIWVIYPLESRKSLFIIAGNDPRKTDLAPVISRHEQCVQVLKNFEPFFEYSDISKYSNLDGESNIFKILALNPFQKIDAFYIVGTDHYYRLNPVKGQKDTIQKLEENIKDRIYGYNEMLHSVSVIFAPRSNGANIPVETTLNTGFIPSLKFDVSSTLIRNALFSQDKTPLALLPYDVYQHILKHGLPRKIISFNTSNKKSVASITLTTDLIK